MFVIVTLLQKIVKLFFTAVLSRQSLLMYLHLDWNSLCSEGLSQTLGPFASAFGVKGLHACTTTLGTEFVSERTEINSSSMVERGRKEGDST